MIKTETYKINSTFSKIIQNLQNLTPPNSRGANSRGANSRGRQKLMVPYGCHPCPRLSNALSWVSMHGAASSALESTSAS